MLVNRGETAGAQLKSMIGDRSCVRAGQIEVHVAAQVHDGGLVRDRGQFDHQRGLFFDRILCLNLQGPRETTLSVCRNAGQNKTVFGVIHNIPDPAMKARAASMQAMAAFVRIQLVADAPEFEPRIFYAVCVSSDQGAQVVLRIGQVPLQICITKDNVRPGAMPIRRHQRHDPAPEVGDRGPNSVSVSNFEQRHPAIVRSSCHERATLLDTATMTDMKSGNFRGDNAAQAAGLPA